MKALSRTGSFLDGGASHVLQDAAIPLLDPSLVIAEMKALQQHFVKKRDFVVERSVLIPSRKLICRLNAMGLHVTAPDATFYIWVNCIYDPCSGN